MSGMASEIADILSGFSTALESSSLGTRYGSVKLRSGSSSSDGRRHIPSQFLESVSSHASLVENATYGSNSLLYDVVEPLDLEQEIEAQMEAVAGKEDGIRNLAEFPVDDIQMVANERQFRTTKPPVPKDAMDLTTHLKCCLKSYTQGYSVVQRNYEVFGSGKLVNTAREKVDELKDQLPKQVYEGDPEEENTAEESSNENANAKSRGSWASSIINLKNSQADALLKNLLDSTPQEEIDDENAKLRSKGRYPHFFSLFLPLQPANVSANSSQTAGTFEDSEFAIECRTYPPPPFEHFGYRILVKCLSLELEMDVEPIYASIALYDPKPRKKISETFYFDLNSDPIRKMIKQEGSPSISTLARSAIFSLTHPSHDVYLVIKLEKVLQQGDIGECSEPYMKDATDKSRDKAKQNAKWFCDRLGRYRMPFAWTAINLMNIVNSASNLRPVDDADSNHNPDESTKGENGSRSSTLTSQSRHQTLARQCSLNEGELQMLSAFKPVTLTVSSFFKQEGERLKDEDLYKFLMDLKRPSNILKRLKCIPGKMKVDVSPCPHNFPYCITPDLYRVKPYPDQRGRPTREIQEFSSRDIRIPYTTYRNLLYVYPQTVNFTNRPNHARNIAIKVQLLESEDPASVQSVIYGKSNCPELSTDAYTAITYHNKNPDFYEEIKIQLPTRLTSRHHLFFSFYHISCQRKQDLTPIETLVGFTWLPLLQGGRLRTGEISLPVSADKLPPHYSINSPEAQIQGVKWIDGHKAIFSVHIDTVSTVHLLDRYLENFFGLCDLIDHPPANGILNAKLADGTRIDDVEGELRKVIYAMTTDSRLPALVNHLHVVLDKLVKMLVRPPVIGGQSVNMGQNCLEALARICNRLHRAQDFETDTHQRNILLSTYAKHVFSVPSFERNASDQSEAEPAAKASHFATMTRQEKRSRPSVSKATFHISSSNPDLSAATQNDDAFADESANKDSDDRNFVRHSMTRSSLMEQVGRHQAESTGVRSVSHKIFHEELALLFVVSPNTVKDAAWQNTWFLFELMTKSMTQYLHESGLLMAPRRQRFRHRFLDDLKRLVKSVSSEICTRYSRDYDMAERLNCSLAFLFNDLLSIMDRGFVLQLLHVYSNQLNDKLASHLMTSHASLLQLRVALLRIVCSHEHYVTMNLPFSLPPTPSSPTPSVISNASSFISSGLSKSTTKYDLNERFTRQHFLTGLLLSDIRLSFELAEQNYPSMGKVQLYALTTLRNLMASHDADPRINKYPEVKRAVAALYLPLLSLAIKALQFAHTFNEERSAATPSVGEDGMISASVATAIANPSPQLSRSNTTTNLSSSQMSPECTRNLLACFLWLLKNTEESTLKSWWVALPPSHLIAILDLLYISVSCFELSKSTSGFAGRGDSSRSSLKSVTRKKDSKSRLQDAILGESSARRELLMRRRGAGSEKVATLGPAVAKDGLRWNKDRTEWKQVKHEERKKHFLEDSPVARNFSAEATMVVLDTLELLVATATELHDGTGTSQILACALRVLLHCFSKRQSVSVLQHAFAIQRSIVAKFPELVFEEETEQCADLTLRLLEKCSSNNNNVRTNASASLYMLMRHNFSMGSTFARVKMQITMSMSSLVGVSHTFEEEFLRRSLKTILSYAEIDHELENTTFPEQVRDLVFNLHMIISDTVKMKEHKEDPEMLIDLMYRIAKGYQNSPDLRLTWLQNMANQHSERKNHAEAGMCLLHCAALVAEYLSMMDFKAYLPVGCVTFEKISANILEESAVSDDVLTSHADEVCSEKYFSPAGLTAILEQAAGTFSQGGLHEVVDMIYQILIPIYQHSLDYKKLAQIHGKLQESFGKINSQVGKRMFGTYFRVGFYGAKFGDLNGEEFIYKEPAITKLPEISHRLESFYKQCFGADTVEMIKDSSTIDPSTLDPDKAYIQITFVEPYFYEYENDKKTCYFDRNFNINKFMYATPFTKDGKAHGEMKEQFKRKTFLQVSNAFPYIKTRISVIKRWEKVLSPLESACEDVKKKTSQLIKATNQNPPDIRMLQVNLQGAVLTSVNQGPMEVANTFLVEIPDEPKLWVHFNELRLSFKEFDHACSLALKKNKTLISSDQKEYQREMERNYNKMSAQLKQLVGNREIVRRILNASNSELFL